MKLNTRLALFVVALLFSAFEMRAQESNPEKIVRPRVVTQEPQTPGAARQTVGPQFRFAGWWKSFRKSPPDLSRTSRRR